jgi:hypothetical protein
MTVTLAAFQLMAYIALTFASVTVAGLSAFIAYRSNFGWKPIALITTRGFRSSIVPDIYFARITFEVWNRRKYPIAVRSAKVTFATLNIIDHPPEEEPPSDGKKYNVGWHRQGKRFYYRGDFILAPGAHEQFHLEAAFPKRSLDDLHDDVTISITHFDPRMSKHKHMRLRTVFELK